jgi:hypothetical protein
MDKLKVFISSPGDVAHERAISKRVIRKLQKECAGSVTLDGLMWEDLPLQATASFQDGINRVISPEGVDIAVFILWARLGSPPGDKYVKADGSLYRSGTEYEYDLMHSASIKTNGQKPAILVYVKNAESEIPEEAKANISKIREWIEQKEATQEFIRERLHDPSSKTIQGAYHQFASSADFEQKLTEHLRRLISERTECVESVGWKENPYLGLRSFDRSNESIFYGRRRVINEIETLLFERANQTAPSLFMIGPSGSGKSSLVKAGLLPDLFDSHITKRTSWQYASFTPAQYSEKISSEILRAVGEKIPSLTESPAWSDFCAGRDVDLRYITEALAHARQSHQASSDETTLLIYIDQFEELFTNPLVSETDRIQAINVLRLLVQTKQIWFIFAMRSDFYQKFTEYPALLEMKRECVLYDIPNMLNSEVREIVEEPARKAGLKWEVDKQGNSLNNTILNDIATYENSLPLIELMLSMLYERRDSTNVLTYAAYEEIGGVNGAIISYANAVHTSFSEPERLVLEDIIGSVIVESQTNENLYTKRVVSKDELYRKSPAHKHVVDTLVSQHLLVSGKNGDGCATITLVHDVLIEKWEIIQAFIKREKELIKLNRFYDTQAAHWETSLQAQDNLISANAALDEAEHFLYLWEKKASAHVNDFIRASIRKKRRKGFYFILTISAISLILLLVGLIAWLFYPDMIKEQLPEAVQMTPRDILLGLPMYIQFFALLLHFNYLKFRAKPIFETIRISALFWKGMALVSLLDIVCTVKLMLDSTDSDNRIGPVISLALPLFVFSRLVLVKRKQKIIKTKWASGLGKSRDGFRHFSIIGNASMAVFTLLMILSILALWGNMVSEKQEQAKELDKTYGKLMQLYRDLNNISDRLFFADIIYVNSERLRLLESQYADSLLNTQSQYAEDYALSQFALYHPDSAYNYHYSGNNSLLHAKISTTLGNTKRASEFLKKTYSDFKLAQIPANFAWIAERNGEFDLARRYFEAGRNAELFALDRIDPLTMNYAHSLLMTGHIDTALAIYKRHMQSSFPDGRAWKSELENDFLIFHWLGLDSAAISQAERQLGINVRKVQASSHNSSDMGVIKQIAGEWRSTIADTIIAMTIPSDTLHLIFHSTKDTTERELERGCARFRVIRKNHRIILSEYDPLRNIVTENELIVITKNQIELRAINTVATGKPSSARFFVRANI